MEFKISDGYRSARNLSTATCAGVLGWSALQFEIKGVQIDIFGSLDLTTASIPLILIALIFYNCFRTTIEFMMQSVEIRRWKYAQLDYKILFWLTIVSLAVLGASAVHRSFETIPYTLAAWGVLLLAIVPLTIVSYVFTLPVTFLVGKLKKRKSVASMAMEALAWATAVTLLLYFALIIAGSVAAATWEPISSYWNVKPTSFNLMLFAFSEIFVTYAIFAREGLFIVVFFINPRQILERDSRGKPKIIRIGERPSISEEWYQKPKEAASSTEPDTLK